MDRLTRLGEEIRKELKKAPISEDKLSVLVRGEDIIVVSNTFYYSQIEKLMRLSRVYGFYFFIEAKRKGGVRVVIHDVSFSADEPFERYPDIEEISTIDGRFLIEIPSHYYEIRPNSDNIEVLRTMTKRYVNKKVIGGN